MTPAVRQDESEGAHILAEVPLACAERTKQPRWKHILGTCRWPCGLESSVGTAARDKDTINPTTKKNKPCVEVSMVSPKDPSCAKPMAGSLRFISERERGLLALHFQVTVLHWRKSISNLKSSLFFAPHSITLNQRIHSPPQKYSRNHGGITLAGSLIASCSADFLTQPRTGCPSNSPAHSRQGPSVSINNQDNGPQSCPQAKLI